MFPVSYVFFLHKLHTFPSFFFHTFLLWMFKLDLSFMHLGLSYRIVLKAGQYILDIQLFTFERLFLYSLTLICSSWQNCFTGHL